MQKINISELLANWARREKLKIEEVKKRRYLHFDAPIKSVGLRLVKEISNPDFVIRRFFYPFVQDTQTIRKYKTDKDKKYVGTKDRPICYASHKDAFIFSWYAHLLNHLYELKLDELGISENVIAYRSKLKKNNVHFAKDVFDFIRSKGDCAVLCFDVIKFFDSLDHRLLKNVWRSLLADHGMLINNNLPADHYSVYKASTEYSIATKKNLLNFFKIDNKNLKEISKFCDLKQFREIVRMVGLIHKNKTKKGVPQGIAVSSVLSNMYMLGFDKSMAEYAGQNNGLYRRYSDDIIMVCDKIKYPEVKKFVCEKIADLKLEIQSEKTEIRLFSVESDGALSCVDEENNVAELQYLGIQTNGRREILRGKTVAKYQRRITGSVKKEIILAKKSKNQIAKKRLNKKYIHTEKRSFIAYAKMSTKILKSDELKKQFSERQIIKVIDRKISKYSKK